MWEEYQLYHKNGEYQLFDDITNNEAIASTIIGERYYDLSKEQCHELFDNIDTEKLLNDETDKWMDSVESLDLTYNMIKVFGFQAGFEKGFYKALELLKDNQYNRNDLVRVEKCYLRECDNDIKYRGQIVQRIENEKNANNRSMKVLVEMEETRPVISGGLRTMNDNQTPGLTFHSEKIIKVDSNGFINMKKYE